MNHALKFKSLILLLILMLTLVSCAGNTSNKNEEAAVNTAPKETKIYSNLFGDTEIPTHPKKIVSDWYYGDLVALGVKPVGLTSYVLNNHPFIDPAGTADIGDIANLEAVAQLEPDLIILYGKNEKYEEFSKIAPTIGLELYPDPIQSVRTFGEILGKEQEAEQWISDFEVKVAVSKEKLSDTIREGETFTIFNLWKTGLRVYGDINMGGYIMYKALGLQPQERVLSDIINADTVNAGTAISLEELPSFAGDNIILTSYQGDELEKELKDSAIWNNLEAVKNNKVYEVELDLLYNEDPIAMLHQLDVLTDLILSRNQ